MSPEVHFPVGSRKFEEVSQLVSQKGIVLEPLSKFTTEKYPGSENRFPNEKDYVDINGGLTFKNELFPFTLQIVESSRGSLTVDISDQKLKTANELVETLDAIFPRYITPLPSQVVATSSKVIWHRISWGCLIVSVCFFFFIYGIYKFFVVR